MGNGKQAYLIIAHKNDLAFQTLLSMLDDPGNAIFVHMDVKNTAYSPAETESHIHHATICHTERTNVNWGGYSQLNAELILLTKAVQTGPYNHYHLLSGQDLPIQSQKDIQAFFQRNTGKEFVSFAHPDFQDGNRVWYHHFFQEKAGRLDSKNYFWQFVNWVPLTVQTLLHIKRNQGIAFQKGANWFSITDEFARYVVSRTDWVEQVFKDSYCCDEVFLQTLLINSPFLPNLYRKEFDDSYDSIVRLIDWKRGSPYTFQLSDLAELKASPKMFARKFDSERSKELIQALQQLYSA